MKPKLTIWLTCILIASIVSGCLAVVEGRRQTPSPTPRLTPTPTNAIAPTETDTPVPPTETSIPPTATATPSEPVEPYPSAPLCSDSGAGHNYTLFHTLWDETRGCHYDHEHGYTPFTAEVANTFPGFNLLELGCFMEVGHCNPSSPIENLTKHGGMKWDVRLVNYNACNGREDVPTGVDAFAIQYHGFGNYSIEFESRIHSAMGVLRQCRNANPTDYGYVYVSQHQDYGQRTAPYQGVVLPYPDTPLPAYDAAREPYLAVTCFGGIPGTKCARIASRQAMLDDNNNAETTWISEPVNITGSGSPLFFILFRGLDTYQALDASDMTYPFTFVWMCSSDGGNTYDPSMPGCRWNNSTTRVHELGGNIPIIWDNLSGFDTDSRVGRITAEGYVTRFGTLAPACTQPSVDCHPIKLVNAFTDKYGTGLGITPTKTNAFDPANLAERDIYFCNGVVCNEFDPGAVPSGWIGANN